MRAEEEAAVAASAAVAAATKAASTAARYLVEDAVGAEIQACDPQQALRSGDFQDVLDEVSDKIIKVMRKDERAEMDDEDRAFIGRRVRRMVNSYLDQYMAERAKPTRFKRTERVVCRMGGARPWASGSIAAVNEDDPNDPTGQTKLPYVVKMDPPGARLISVPKDDYDTCRAEVCFGSRAGALWFTLFCLPSRKVSDNKRFAVGERVACAVEDESDDYSVWAAGTVEQVNYSVEEEAKEMIPDREWAGTCVPYRVQLDSGGMVLVHKDEHWLLRDLELQAAGPRQTKEGTRVSSRLEKRHRGDYTFEAVDHMTRKVRPCAAPDSDDEHSDDCGCGC